VSRSYLCLNRVREARAVAERGLAVAGGSSAALHLVLFGCALADNDAASLARERAWAAGHPDAAEPHASEVEADVALGQGRLRHALALLAQREAWASAHEQPTHAAASRLWMAYFEALVGRRERAIRRLDEERRRGVPPALTFEALKVAAFADDLELTARLLDEIERVRAPGVQPDTTFVRTFRAVLAAREGRLAEAIDQLRPLEPSELGFLYEYLPLFERARIDALAGRWDAARDAFAKILANPNVGPVRKLLPLAELGLARTLARAGDIAGARAAYERFFERWREADPDLPLLLEARREHAALPK
jgi:tetratricopeptide (TPR) repeat protein